MCGHVGVAGFITAYSKDAFKDLLHLDYLRGMDSTGIAAIRMPIKNDNVVKQAVFKELGGPWNIYDKYIKNFSEKGSFSGFPDILLGHNRHATQGKIDAESAHPFVFPNLIGAHNGTVSQYLLKDFHDYSKYVIDSQIIFSQIDHDPDLNFVWKKANGALALVWFDKRDNSLHFARNKERSLFYTIDEKKTRIYWASEEWMLKVALHKNTQECKEIHPFKENVHYTLDMTNPIIEMKEEVLETPPPIATTTYKSHNYLNGYNGYNYQEENDFFSFKCKRKGKKGVALKFYIKEMQESEWGPFFWGISTQGLSCLINPPLKEEEDHEEEIKRIKETPTTELWYADWEDAEFKSMGNNSVYILESRDITKSSEILAKKSNVVDIHSKYEIETKGFKGERLTKLDFEERLKEGCSNCLEVIEWKDRFKLRWIDSNNAYCPSCVTLPVIKKELQRIYGGAKNA